MSQATKEEVLAATTRRTEIVDRLLDLLTSDFFSTKELQRYRFIGEIFHVNAVLKELIGEPSTIEARTELALSIALSALSICIDPTPPPPSERVLARREAAKERRDAEREFKQKLAGKDAVEPGKPVKSVQASTTDVEAS